MSISLIWCNHYNGSTYITIIYSIAAPATGSLVHVAGFEKGADGKMKQVDNTHLLDPVVLDFLKIANIDPNSLSTKEIEDVKTFAEKTQLRGTRREHKERLRKSQMPSGNLPPPIPETSPRLPPSSNRSKPPPLPSNPPRPAPMGEKSRRRPPPTEPPKIPSTRPNIQTGRDKARAASPSAGPAPPPPPPPGPVSPPAAAEKRPPPGPAAPKPRPGGGGGLLGEIQAGKPLKKTPPPEKPAPEGRGGLLAQIQAGTTLKKVPAEDNGWLKLRATNGAKEATERDLHDDNVCTFFKSYTSCNGGLGKRVQYSDSEEESEDDDDSDWTD